MMKNHIKGKPSKHFWYTKFILRCWNMFYIQGEVIPDQIYHLKFIWFGVSLVHSGKNLVKNRKFWKLGENQKSSGTSLVKISSGLGNFAVMPSALIFCSHLPFLNCVFKWVLRELGKIDIQLTNFLFTLASLPN